MTESALGITRQRAIPNASSLSVSVLRIVSMRPISWIKPIWRVRRTLRISDSPEKRQFLRDAAQHEAGKSALSTERTHSPYSLLRKCLLISRHGILVVVSHQVVVGKNRYVTCRDGAPSTSFVLIKRTGFIGKRWGAAFRWLKLRLVELSTFCFNCLLYTSPSPRDRG